MSRVVKFAGRPPGAKNKNQGFIRDKLLIHQRVTPGFLQVLDFLQEVMPGKTSKSDVLHEALRELALKKLSTKKHIFWIQKIM